MDENRNRARRTVADIALAHSAIGVALSEAARSLDELEGEPLRGKLFSVSTDLRFLGDAEHDTARALRDLALGDLRYPVDESRLTVTADIAPALHAREMESIRSFPAYRHLPRWKLWLKHLLKL